MQIDRKQMQELYEIASDATPNQLKSLTDKERKTISSTINSFNRQKETSVIESEEVLKSIKEKLNKPAHIKETSTTTKIGTFVKNIFGRVSPEKLKNELEKTTSTIRSKETRLQEVKNAMAERIQVLEGKSPSLKKALNQGKSLNITGDRTLDKLTSEKANLEKFLNIKPETKKPEATFHISSHWGRK